MSLPQPKVALDNVCSVVFNNTLYTYSATAFQSLTLTNGSEWKTLPSGQGVTGGVCVGSTPGDPSLAAFWVVGGTGAPASYPGLQMYTYSTGAWTTITPITFVTQDRLYHGATYLNATNSLVVYAGSQDGTMAPSSETFTIGAAAPFAVGSYSSAAPPAINPILLPWSTSQAVMIGGSTTNTEVMLFDPTNQWVNSEATLAAPLLKNSSAIQAALVTGDDGSKNMYTFDMTVSPNQVNRTILLNGAGQPIADATPVVSRSLEDDATGPNSKERRQSSPPLNEVDWPEYNSTLAPTVVRSSYALATDGSGLVVIAGGSSTDVLAMFDGRANSWINATAKLGAQVPLVQTSSTTSATSTSMATSTSTASSSATSAAATSQVAAAPIATSSSTNQDVTPGHILAILLGILGGIAVVLFLIYFCIRQYKKRGNRAVSRKTTGTPSSEKEDFGLPDDTVLPGPGFGGGRGFRGHQPQASMNSVSSMAILMGKVGQNKSSELSRNGSNNTRRDSEDTIFRTQFKSTISKPIPQATENVVVQPGAERSIAFGPGTAGPRPRPPRPERPDGTRRSSGWNRYWSGGSALNILGFGNGTKESRRTTVDSDASRYSDQPNHRMTQDSATVPPLQVPEGPPAFSRVNSGSPTMAYHPRVAQQAQIERSSSRASSRSGYSSGIPASIHDAWDPTSTGSRPWGADRAPSSAYSNTYTTGLVSGAGSKPAPPGISRQPQLAMAATSSDMSWLNIGDHNRV